MTQIRLNLNVALVAFALGIFNWVSAQGADGKSAQDQGGPKSLDLQHRIGSREFPSVFQAWISADNLKNEDPLRTMSRHDLAISNPQSFQLRWNNTSVGLAGDFEPGSIVIAKALREKLLHLNPHMILLAEIRYRDAPKNYLPDGSVWWKRKDGVKEPGWKEGGYFLLDFSDSSFQTQVATQARAAMASGVFDGVFLDWWSDDNDRLELIKAVRSAVGDKAIVIANANDLETPRTGKYLNGYYMECWRSETPKDWKRIAETLQWAEKTLREPRVNCVETWYHNSRRDLNLMRATTALTLTMSDGYCLFCDPDPLPTPDHLHDWYPYWDKSLGKPIQRGFARSDGGWQREFDRGSVIYNPLGNGTINVIFDSPRLRLSTREKGSTFSLTDCDGDLFLTPDN